MNLFIVENLSIKIMNKEQLLKALKESKQEIGCLRYENEQLLTIVIDSIQHVIRANEMEANYQKKIDQMISLIRSRYDINFKIENIHEF